MTQSQISNIIFWLHFQYNSSSPRFGHSFRALNSLNYSTQSHLNSKLENVKKWNMMECGEEESKWNFIVLSLMSRNLRENDPEHRDEFARFHDDESVELLDCFMMLYVHVLVPQWWHDCSRRIIKQPLTQRQVQIVLMKICIRWRSWLFRERRNLIIFDFKCERE